MPSYKVSGGIEGAASTLLEHIQRQTKRREEEEDDFRKFRFELQKAELEWQNDLRRTVAGRKDANPEYLNALLSGKPTTGMDALSTQPFTPPDGMELWQTTDPATGAIYRRPSETGGEPFVPEPQQGGGLFSSIRNFFSRKTPEVADSGQQGSAELPDAEEYVEGDVIEDISTGQQYRLIGGAWQPI